MKMKRKSETIMYKTLAPTFAPVETSSPTFAPSFAPTAKPSTWAPSASTSTAAAAAGAVASISTDEYLVYSTVIIFAVVIFACGGMWFARPAKRSKPQQVQDLESGGGQSAGKKSGGTTIKKTKGSGSAVSSSTAGGKRKTKSKTKSALHGGDDATDDNALETSSEASSLLGGEVLTAAAGGGRNSTLTSSPALSGAAKGGGYKDLSPQDEALRKTFHSVLKEGMTMLLHTGDKTPKPIQLTLVGTELRWKAAKVFARNQYKIDLRDIKFVEWGKQTSTFLKHPSMGASEDLCFSLITDKVTVDLEASSKVERDALVQGFSLVVSGLRLSGGV